MQAQRRLTADEALLTTLSIHSNSSSRSDSLKSLGRDRSLFRATSTRLGRQTGPFVEASSKGSPNATRVASARSSGGVAAVELDDSVYSRLAEAGSEAERMLLLAEVRWAVNNHLCMSRLTKALLCADLCSPSC